MHTDVSNGLYVYTQLYDGDIKFNLEYDKLGRIKAVSTFVDTLGLVNLDLSHLEINMPSRYAYIQEKVNEGLAYFKRYNC